MRDIIRRTAQRLQQLPFPFVLRVFEKVDSRKKVLFSSYGEDAILAGILSRYFLDFREHLELSYVDIGAWRPIAASNTYFLYQRGSRGTVVEPNPHFRKLWKAVRPEDQYLGVGCSSEKFEELIIFHDNAASNTLDLDFAGKIAQQQSISIAKKITVPCLTLGEIIKLHLSNHNSPFLLDIDVEGRDFEIIQDYDFPTGGRPILIFIEDVPTDILLTESSIHIYLASHEYRLIARSAITSLYIDTNHKLSTILAEVG